MENSDLLNEGAETGGAAGLLRPILEGGERDGGSAGGKKRGGKGRGRRRRRGPGMLPVVKVGHRKQVSASLCVGKKVGGERSRG